MGQSCGFCEGIDGAVVLKHCPKDGDASALTGDQCLGMAFSLAALAVANGFGERDFGADGALIDDAFRRVVSAEGLSPACLFGRLADDGGKACGRALRRSWMRTRPAMMRQGLPLVGQQWRAASRGADLRLPPAKLWPTRLTAMPGA